MVTTGESPERVLHFDAQPREVACVAGDDGEGAVEGGGGDHDVFAAVAGGGLQFAPDAGDGYADRDDAVGEGGDRDVEPVVDAGCEFWIAPGDLNRAAADFGDRDDAQKQVRRFLFADPGERFRVSAARERLGHRHRVEQIHVLRRS